MAIKMKSDKEAGQEYFFGTKAETLERLAPLLSCSDIPLFYYFTIQEWTEDSANVLKKIQLYFNRSKIIIRSSAYMEDTALSSMAGLHDSIPDISAKNENLLCRSINRVISSYNILNREVLAFDQVLIQLMIRNISMSGVVFTQDLNTGAPYYVINYDDITGRTDTVTAGKEYSNRTLLIHRCAVNKLKSERFKALLRAVQEVEKVTNHDSLDIEFAVDRSNRVYILQVRQIATQPNWNRAITAKVNKAVKRMTTFVKDYQIFGNAPYGKRIILGKMPDWNPAEMLGSFPRPLALSLYSYLITDYAWHNARKQMGYLELRDSRLMISLCGKPYIDVCLSFNSFLPKDLEPGISEKIVNAWLERLSEHKELHDKVEFDVAITCLAFDFDKSVKEQIPGVLSKEEERKFKRCLFNLTNDLLTQKIAPVRKELAKINLLEKRRRSLLQRCDKSDLRVASSLLEDCIRLGTIPFAVLARHAFIAKSFIRSMVRRAVLTESEATLFQKSIKTIAGDLVNDIDCFAKGKIKTADFMEKYGHLRPGTYDIMSLRYDQREDLINGMIQPPIKSGSSKPFFFSSKQLYRINKLLKECGYAIDPDRLLRYMKEAIAAREYAKFVFTKNISSALEIIANWGAAPGLSREELSYITIGDMLNTVNIPKDKTFGQRLRNLASRGREEHGTTLAICLPYLIEKPEDVSIIPLLLCKANFITHKTVRASYVFIDSQKRGIPDIMDKIVLIENADPGFDWIFSRRLVGLVTKFGGVNSHMAIRCAEFGLPAAIGCGEQIFDRILHSRAIEINCSEGRITPIEA